MAAESRIQTIIVVQSNSAKAAHRHRVDGRAIEVRALIAAIDQQAAVAHFHSTGAQRSRACRAADFHGERATAIHPGAARVVIRILEHHGAGGVRGRSGAKREQRDRRANLHGGARAGQRVVRARERERHRRCGIRTEAITIASTGSERADELRTSIAQVVAAVGTEEGVAIANGIHVDAAREGRHTDLHGGTEEGIHRAAGELAACRREVTVEDQLTKACRAAEHPDAADIVQRAHRSDAKRRAGIHQHSASAERRAAGGHHLERSSEDIGATIIGIGVASDHQHARTRLVQTEGAWAIRHHTREFDERTTEASSVRALRKDASAAADGRSPCEAEALVIRVRRRGEGAVADDQIAELEAVIEVARAKAIVVSRHVRARAVDHHIHTERGLIADDRDHAWTHACRLNGECAALEFKRSGRRAIRTAKTKDLIQDQSTRAQHCATGVGIHVCERIIPRRRA